MAATTEATATASAAAAVTSTGPAGSVLPAADGPHPVSWRVSVRLIACHLVPLLAVFTGVNRDDLVLLGVLYVGRVFFITAGYHRYFSHRAFRVGRVTQFVLAFGGLTAMQKGPLWWAS